MMAPRAALLLLALLHNAWCKAASRGVGPWRGRMQLADAESAEACISARLSSARWYQCPNGSSLNDSVTDRVGVTDAIRTCFGVSVQQEPIRVLVPPSSGSLAAAIESVTDVLDSVTGHELEVTVVASAQQWVPTIQQSIENPRNYNTTHEAWFLSAAAVGDGIRAGAVADLTNRVVSDPKLAWFEIFEPIKSNLLVYDGKVVSHPNIDDLVYDDTVAVFPSRASQLSPSLFKVAGFNLDDSRRWLRMHAATVFHPNAHVQPRFPRATPFVFLLRNASAMVVSAPGISGVEIQRMMQGVSQQLVRDFVAGAGGPEAAKVVYWKSLNRFIPSPPPPPTAPLYGPTAPTYTQSRGVTISLVVPAVVAPTLVLMTIAGFVLRRYLSRKYSRRGQRVPHPGPGPDTTLLVTDIEDSTALWETLPAVDMDVSLRLHNSCVRTLAAEHNGYESIWEGDSFTIAFPTATHAAKFALALQQALLHLAWPSALLSTEQGGELWFVRTDPSATIPMHEHDAGADSKRSQDTQACGSNRQSLDMTHMGIQTILQSGEYEVYHTSRQRDSAPTRMQQQHGKHHVPMHGLMQWPKPPSSGQIDTQFEAYMGDSECGTISTNQDSMGLTSTWDGQSAVGSTHVGKKRKGVFGKLSLGKEKASVSSQQPQIETLASNLKRSWVQAEHDTPGAVLAYRGLRVRVGMHSGVYEETEITINQTNRRYQYTGEARVLSAAISSVANGGQIFASQTSTLARLQATHKHTGKDLEMKLVYMGRHELIGGQTDGRILDLVCMVPRALRCRQAHGSTAKPPRNTRCLLPGALAAPIAAQPAARGGGGPYLAAVQLVGYEALHAWNALDAMCALRGAAQWATHSAFVHGGVIIEDPWNEALQDRTPWSHGDPIGEAPMPPVSRAHSRCVAKLRSSMLLAAFTSPAGAITFAIMCRDMIAGQDGQIDGSDRARLYGSQHPGNKLSLPDGLIDDWQSSRCSSPRTTGGLIGRAGIGASRSPTGASHATGSPVVAKGPSTAGPAHSTGTSALDAESNRDDNHSSSQLSDSGAVASDHRVALPPMPPPRLLASADHCWTQLLTDKQNSQAEGDTGMGDVSGPATVHDLASAHTRRASQGGALHITKSAAYLASKRSQATSASGLSFTGARRAPSFAGPVVHRMGSSSTPRLPTLFAQQSAHGGSILRPASRTNSASGACPQQAGLLRVASRHNSTSGPLSPTALRPAGRTQSVTGESVGHVTPQIQVARHGSVSGRLPVTLQHSLQRSAGAAQLRASKLSSTGPMSLEKRQSSFAGPGEEASTAQITHPMMPSFQGAKATTPEASPSTNPAMPAAVGALWSAFKGHWSTQNQTPRSTDMTAPSPNTSFSGTRSLKRLMANAATGGTTTPRASDVDSAGAAAVGNPSSPGTPLREAGHPRLSVRAAVAGGPYKLELSATTGRAMYSGRGRQKLDKLLSVAKAGQVVTSTRVATEARMTAAGGATADKSRTVVL